MKKRRFDPTRRRSEHDEQAEVFQWAALNERRYPELRRMHSIPNGVLIGGRNKFALFAKLKKEGLRPSTPDIFLPAVRKSAQAAKIYSGAYIEMKALDGTLDDDQRAALEDLAKFGYYAVACYGATEAIEVIENYLKGDIL